MEKNRRNFLRSASLTSLGILSAGLSSIMAEDVPLSTSGLSYFKPGRGIDRFNMNGFSAPKLDKVRVGIIGLRRGLAHLRSLIKFQGVEIKAICDLLPENIETAQNLLKSSKHNPTVYTGGEDEWKKLCNRDDIDFVYVATPWNLHAPMALYAMNHGKHVGMEVPGPKTIEECWDLVLTSERTRKHCMVLENYCYIEFPLLVLNMAKRGFFGEIISGDGSYIHNILGNITRKNFKWEMWRLKENMNRGDLYPTHGLGPIAQVMDINRGDKFDFIVSVLSDDFTLKAKVQELGETDDFYTPYMNKEFNGNMCTSIIRTKRGKTIMLQHDVTSPNVMTQIYKIVGTKGSALEFPYPSRISNIDFGDKWITEEDLEKLKSQYKPDILKKIGEFSKDFEHGGSDFVMNWRIIDCLRNGLPMDIDVYDTATWAAVTELSAISIAKGSNSVKVPDFTDGLWKNNKPLDLSISEGGNTKILH